MLRQCALSAFLVAAACTPPAAVNDPHAAGPSNRQWRANVAGSPTAVFDVVMRVLSDSSYKVTDARKDAGMINTDWRKEADVQRGTQQLKTMLGRNTTTRLQVLVLAHGADSSTVVLTGDERLVDIDMVKPIDTYSQAWRLLRGIGEAILASPVQRE